LQPPPRSPLSGRAFGGLPLPSLALGEGDAVGAGHSLWLLWDIGSEITRVYAGYQYFVPNGTFDSHFCGYVDALCLLFFEKKTPTFPNCENCCHHAFQPLRHRRHNHWPL
jgi:hypothetical protein